MKSNRTTAAMGDNQATHDVFEVIEQEEGERARWNRIGLAYSDDEGRQMTVVKLGAGTRVLELRLIDRAERPIPAGREARMYPSHELFEQDEMIEKRVGVAFVNRDGSLSLVIDEGMREGKKTRVQMRRVKRRVARAA